VTALERWLAGLLLTIALLGACWIGAEWYGMRRYSAGQNAGYAAAIAAGNAQHDRDAAAAHKTETDLRAQLAERDADAHRKEQEYAENLDAAPRRVRAGTDRLRCPASPVQPTTAPTDRPVAAVAPVDGGGPDIVPEVAAEILSDGAAVAGLVRRYQQVVERFEACRAVNAK